MASGPDQTSSSNPGRALLFLSFFLCSQDPLAICMALFSSTHYQFILIVTPFLSCSYYLSITFAYVIVSIWRGVMWFGLQPPRVGWATTCMTFHVGTHAQLERPLLCWLMICYHVNSEVNPQCRMASLDQSIVYPRCYGKHSFNYICTSFNHKIGYLIKLSRHLNHSMSPTILALGIALS